MYNFDTYDDSVLLTSGCGWWAHSSSIMHASIHASMLIWTMHPSPDRGHHQYTYIYVHTIGIRRTYIHSITYLVCTIVRSHGRILCVYTSTIRTGRTNSTLPRPAGTTCALKQIGIPELELLLPGLPTISSGPTFFVNYSLPWYGKKKV